MEGFMETGFVFTTFVIMLRETLEASIVVGIILTILSGMNQKKYFPHVIISILVAVIISVIAGFGLMTLTESVKGGMEKLIEGGVSLMACGVLTYMIFWMAEQSKHIKTDIEAKLEVAISRKEYVAIISIPFLAIFREGAETVLFLSALNTKGAVSWVGALGGCSMAIFIACAIFIGGKRIHLGALFRGSGLFLLFVAAGLLAYGIHELQEIKLIPEIIYPVWNINHILNEKQGIGSFLKAIFGYNGNPSLIEVGSYVAYLVGVVFLLSKKTNLLLPVRHKH